MIIRIRRALVAVMTATMMGATLGACVTNEENGTPEGWQQELPPADPTLASMVPQDIHQRGTLTAGTNAPYAPNQFKDSQGHLIGFELDMIKAVGSVLGLNVNVRQMDFNLILPAINAGTLDVGASALTDTEERQKAFDFVDFYRSGTAWATHPDNADGVDPNHACGKSVAVQKGTYSETDEIEQKSKACVEHGEPPINKAVYPTADAAATATTLKRVDAYSADLPVISYAIERSQGKLQRVGAPFDTAPLGFAVKKGSPMAAAYAAALNKLKSDGTYDRILRMWGLEDGAIDRASINLQPVGQPHPSPSTEVKE